MRKVEDLGLSYSKITNTSNDFYLSLSVKISRSKLKKFIPSMNNISSDESLTYMKNEPLSIKGVEFSTIPRKKNKFQPSLLPKLDDSIVTKYGKPLTDKLIKKNSSKKTILQRKETLSEKPQPKQVSPLKTKILTKVSYKEASRLQEWSMISKPELDKIWRNLICVSNGIQPPNPGTFKYFVGKGNNSALIKKLMQSRTWWSQTDDPSEANFVWTQWKDKTFIQSLPKCLISEKHADPSLVPSTSFQVPVRINNNYRQVDLSELGLYRIKSSLSYAALQSTSQLFLKLYNKLEFNQHLSNKKGLFRSLKRFYEAKGKKLFDHHPITFHIKSGEEDPEFLKFLEVFNKHEKMKKKKKCKNLWIVKPGENSNRGNGIQVVKSLAEIKAVINDKTPAKSQRTYMLQKYIEKPLLVNNRKFDIRCYALVTCLNGVIQCYFYADGYIRTCCVEYNLHDTGNNFIHLTNDAVQKHSEDYGKYEDNNKMSYKDLQRYLDFQFPEKSVNFFISILPKIKAIVKDTVLASFKKLDLFRRLNSVELFGYDFMLDSKFKPWIIEVNTNPCLELSSSYLSYLIPTMLENAFRIALDPIFPPPAYSRNHDPIPENRFELIFHELIDGKEILDKRQDSTEDLLLSDAEDLYSDKEN